MGGWLIIKLPNKCSVYQIGMFVVYTEHPIEKAQLEEDHRSVNRHFYVDCQETHNLVNLLRSIAFEYFRGSPSQLAKKLTQLTIDCLNLSLSLTLFREAMALLKQQEDQLQLHQTYFAELSSHLAQPYPQPSLPTPLKLSTDSCLSKLAPFQQSSPAKLAADTEIQDTLDQQLNLRRLQCQLQKSHQTGLFQQPEQGINSLKEKLDLSYKKILNCHNMSQETQWWKFNPLPQTQQHAHSESHSHSQHSHSHSQHSHSHSQSQQSQSQSLSEFKLRGANVSRRQTMQQLVQKDARLQKQIARHLSKERVKAYEGTAKFVKKMKEKLMAAKINRRRRK